MRYFKVAGLIFSFGQKLDCLGERMNYIPFEVQEPGIEENFLFHLDIDCKLQQTNFNHDFTYVNEVGCYGVTCNNQAYEWVLKRVDKEEYFLMKLNVAFQKAIINFEITDAFTMQAADDFVRFAFIYTAASHHTVLLHASCIKLGDKGIAFMGKSGIGKSTHSSLWLRFISGSELLNDDQPAVQFIRNEAVIFGTPWSGKTKCYKSDQARLEAIVCMDQQPYNEVVPIKEITLFTHLLSACSLIKTERKTFKMILATLANISEQVKGAILHNKPEQEAALITYEFLQS